MKLWAEDFTGRFSSREVQNSQVEQRRENRWFGKKMMMTAKGHGRVGAEGNDVLVFLLVLREFCLEIVKVLPTTLFSSYSL